MAEALKETTLEELFLDITRVAYGTLDVDEIEDVEIISALVDCCEMANNLPKKRTDAKTEIHSTTNNSRHLREVNKFDQQQQKHQQQQLQQQLQQNQHLQQQHMQLQQQLSIRQQQVKQNLQQQPNYSTPLRNGIGGGGAGVNLRLPTVNRGVNVNESKLKKRSFAQVTNSMDNHGDGNDPKRISIRDTSLFSTPFQTHTPMEPLSPRELKYYAFGNFVSSSLMDLPQKFALELVQKFTSAIVKSLKMKMDAAETNNKATSEEEPEAAEVEVEQ